MGKLSRDDLDGRKIGDTMATLVAPGPLLLDMIRVGRYKTFFFKSCFKCFKCSKLFTAGCLLRLR